MSLSVSLNHQFSGFTLDVAFDAGAGITALFGRSGAGKSTVIKAVAGLLTPDQGRIDVDGQAVLNTTMGINIPAHQRRIGVVFQEARLFPHLSVADNLRFGARYAPEGVSGPDFDELITLLGLETLLDRAPATLSGGEKQRVAIGRALLAKPRLLLLDEPLASLDAPRKNEILPYLERLRDDADPVPMLYVSHALDEVARLADTLVILEQGRVATKGPLMEVLGDPATAPIIGVREAGAVISGTITSHGDDGLSTLALSACEMHFPAIDAPPGSKLRLRVMAHDVILSKDRPDGLSALNVIAVKIDAIREGHGPGAIVVLRSGSDRLLARVTTRALGMLGLKTGMHCYAIVKATSISPASIGALRD